MNDLVEELINHRKFMDLLEDEVDEKLKALKREQPRSIPYAICWLEMHPGYASLRYISTTTPRSHSIGISPNGFLWRDNCYPNLDMLLNAFKKNPQGVSKAKAVISTTAQSAAVASDRPPPKNRWGSKPAPPPRAPAPTAQSGWGTRPPPPALPPAPVPIQATGATWDTSMPTWGVPAPSYPTGGPPNLPPPPTYMAPPNLPPQPPTLPPRPPPPPTYQPPPQSLPMLPPQPPPFAGGPPAAASQGRGRGRTLPAWMSSQSGS